MGKREEDSVVNGYVALQFCKMKRVLRMDGEDSTM